MPSDAVRSEPGQTTFDAVWLESAVMKTAERPGVGLSGSAALNLGSTQLLTLVVQDGRIIGECSETPEVVFGFSASQISQYLAHEFDPTVAYMKGDLKPQGSTRALLATLDVLSWLHSKD